jgi:hypothetical protein
MKTPRKQSGYLLEVPIILMLVAILSAIFLPMLPIIIRKVFVVLAALIWIAGLYYMIVIPGWQPDTYSRLRYPWSLLSFLAIAAVLVFITVTYVVSG